MRISDWSSDVCSSDLGRFAHPFGHGLVHRDRARGLIANISLIAIRGHAETFEHVLIDRIRSPAIAAAAAKIAARHAFERVHIDAERAKRIRLELVGDRGNIGQLVQPLVELLRFRNLLATLLDHLHGLLDLFDMLEHGRAIEHRDTLRTGRSEEHTSELQSLMRISYAVFCLKKKKHKITNKRKIHYTEHNKIY